MTRYKEEHQIVMKKENSFGLDERIFISIIGCNDTCMESNRMNESNRNESNRIESNTPTSRDTYQSECKIFGAEPSIGQLVGLDHR